MSKSSVIGIFLLLISTFVSATSFAEDEAGCLVRMIDNVNEVNVLLESRSKRIEQGGRRYFVTSDFASQNPWTVQVIVSARKSDPVVTDVAVPEASIEDIRKNYLLEGLLKNGYAKQSNQLTWIVESKNSSCTEDDLSLINFLVFEWFFFG